MSQHPIVTIDHLLTYVENLGHAASLFRRMGFTLSPISRIEPMGISNHLVLMQPLVQGFANHLELMTSHDRTRLPPAMARVLSGAQGTKSMVFGARNASRAQALIQQIGYDVAPATHVKREWVIAPGESVFPEFDVIMPVDAPLTFNTCQYHTVDLYLRPEWIQHANGARHLRRVFATAKNPMKMARRMGELLAVVPSGNDTLSVVAPDGVRLDILTIDAAEAAYGLSLPFNGAAARYLGYEIQVESLAKFRTCLDAGQIAYRCENGRIVIDPSVGLGNLIVFTEDDK